MSANPFWSGQRFAFNKVLGTGDGDTEIVATPGSGKTLYIEHLTVTITTAAAQAFDIEDDGGSPVEIFKAPASLAVGSYYVNHGPLGFPLTANTALQYDCAAAGVGLTVSGYGHVR